MIKFLLAVAGLDAVFTLAVVSILAAGYVRELVRDWREARRARAPGCEVAVDYRSARQP